MRLQNFTGYLMIGIVCVQSAPLAAATCSCASVPLANSSQTTAMYAGQINFSLAFSKHNINDLVAGSSIVEDETSRSRSSNAWIVGIGYGISDYWTVSLVTNFVEHQRQIGFDDNPNQSAQGIGDGLLSFSYTPAPLTVYNQHEYGIGVGLKLGWGDNNVRQSSGPRFAEDMQPSTGADGYVVWGYYAINLNQSGTKQLWFSVDRSFNDSNDFDYQRGDDINVRATWQTELSENLRFSGSVNYRHAKGDIRGSSEIPNTGGEWTNITPTLLYQFGNNWTAGLAYSHPLNRNLDGALQFTTDSVWSISLSKSF